MFEFKDGHSEIGSILPRMDILWTPWRYRYVSTVDSATRQGVPTELSAWPGDTGCVFCNLLEASAHAVANGLSPAEADRAANIVYRGDRCFICLNAFPYNSGHVMILPYAHTAELGKLEPAEAQEMMAMAQQLERVLQKSLSSRRHQSRHEPGKGRRRGSDWASPHAHAATLVRGHKFHDGDWRDSRLTRAAGDYLGSAARGARGRTTIRRALHYCGGAAGTGAVVGADSVPGAAA